MHLITHKPCARARRDDKRNNIQYEKREDIIREENANL